MIVVRHSAHSRAGFTILELTVSLSVLMAGLFTTISLVSVQTRQMTQAEAWCRPAPTYYVVSQSDKWLRKFGATAEVNTQAGQPPWTPPVTGPQAHDLQPTAYAQDIPGQVIDITVKLHDAAG